METFSSLLAVSPRAGSENSLLSRSRGSRHGRLGRNSLGGGSHHSERKSSTGGDGCEGKIYPKEQFFKENTCPVEGMRGKNVRSNVETVPSMANLRAFERWADANSKGKVENEKGAQER